MLLDSKMRTLYISKIVTINILSKIIPRLGLTNFNTKIDLIMDIMKYCYSFNLTSTQYKVIILLLASTLLFFKTYSPSKDVCKL